MHELFTTAILKNSQIVETLKILQGLCCMTPVRQLERRIIFEGPKTNPLLGIGAAQLQSRKPVNSPLWKELNEQLVRQSYYISISHEINESHFGNHSAASDDNASSENTLWVYHALLLLWTNVVIEQLTLKNCGQLYTSLTIQTLQDQN
jgi:hypothetical protein